MASTVQTNAVADLIVRSVLSLKGFVVPIAKTIGKTLERSVDEYHLREM